MIGIVNLPRNQNQSKNLILYSHVAQKDYFEELSTSRVPFLMLLPNLRMAQSKGQEGRKVHLLKEWERSKDLSAKSCF